METALKCKTMPLQKRVAEGVDRGKNHFEILDKLLKDYLDRTRQVATVKAPDAEPMKMLEDIIALNDSILESCAEFDITVGYEIDSVREGYTRFGE